MCFLPPSQHQVMELAPFRNGKSVGNRAVRVATSKRLEGPCKNLK